MKDASMVPLRPGEDKGNCPPCSSTCHLLSPPRVCGPGWKMKPTMVSLRAGEDGGSPSAMGLDSLLTKSTPRLLGMREKEGLQLLKMTRRPWMKNHRVAR